MGLVYVFVSAVLSCHGPRASRPGHTTLTTAEAPFTMPPVAPGTPDVPALVSKISASVVNITATQELRMPGGGADPFEFFFGPGPGRGGGRDDVVKRRGLGSGFIVDAAGHVVTNAHVIANATTVRVTLADEREFDAKVRGRDERLDIAVLELQDATNLPIAVLGRSDALRVGEYVVAIGNPFGLGNTVTMGIVSAKGRELGAGPYDDFIQTDASINPGNSGGPLFNLRGEVVGISTAINPEGRGIGFAIPIDAAKDVVPQLLDQGTISRGKLGIAVQSLDASLAKAMGLNAPHGALVADVERGSSGDRAGLKPGDVIVAVDQTEVVHAHDLPRLIARRSPGSEVTLKVVGRDGHARTVDVTLDKLREKGKDESSGPESRAPTHNHRDFGFDLGSDPSGAAVVRNVDAGSRAAEALEPGDVIMEVNGTPVKNASDAMTRVRGTRADRPLLLKVERNGHPLFIALERG
jgi:serine protease Do